MSHDDPLDGTKDRPFDCSHALRLSATDWVLVGVALLLLTGLTPVAWERFERFEPGPDYRMPYELSSDYWLYSRYCRELCDRRKVLVIGDSVVWGHYVPPEETLTHYLNEFSGQQRFANLGLDGTHPAALEGLLRYYGPRLCGRVVLLHFNPLWMSSAKHDLQTDKEFHFNHPDLVSQFTVPIPCYKAPFSRRARIALRRTVPFSNWIGHVRTTYYESTDVQNWTLRYPYRCPLSPLTRGLPQPAGVPEPAGGTWVEKGAKKQDLAWVELDTSLQWRFFRRSLDLLRQQGNRVFVLVGPFNEHMLNDADAAAYDAIKTQAAEWLKKNKIPHFVPPPLPAEHYVDASHPIGAGYALWAQWILAEPAFAALTK
jgi:lysophospholipase L1-like esterase